MLVIGCGDRQLNRRRWARNFADVKPRVWGTLVEQVVAARVIRGLHFFHRKIELRNVFVTDDVSAVTLVGAGSALHARFDTGNSRDSVAT